MIIERDVIDVLLITISTMILSLILVSENSEFEGNEIIMVGLTLTILITFSHIILLQLEVINPQIGKGFSISTIFTSIMTFIGYLSYDLVDTEGIWNDLGISYEFLFVGSLLLLLISSGLSLFSEQVKSEMI